jgi:predicted RND superfamily exporter protein
MQAAQAVIPALGKLFTPTCGTIPLLIVTIAAAYIIHYFAEMAKHARANPNEDRRVTLRRTVAGILPAALICCLTTVIGFAANAVTDVPALKDYAYFCAIATFITFVVTVLAFCASAPVALWVTTQLARIPLIRNLVALHNNVSDRGWAKSEWMQSAMTRLASWHTRYPKQILFASVLTIVVIFAGVTRIGLGFDQLRNFRADEPIRIATQKMEDNVGGSTEMVVSIKTANEDRFMQPAEMQKLAALDEFFRKEVGADRVLSVVDFVKHMHRGFFNNDPKEYRIPDSAEQTAQLFALNTDVRLYEYIAPGHHWVRIVGRVPAQNSYDLSKKYEKLDRYLAQHFPASAGYTATAAGQHRVYAALTEGISNSLGWSMALGTILIFGLLSLFLRSWAAGLYSVPPNIMPVIINLGLMGWLGIRLSADNAIFATIVLGIAVDDTVHFVHYMRERLARHGSMEQAILEALRFKGPAMIATTVIMIAGFSVMFLSSYQQVINFGFVICFGVGSAVFGDLILLPSLLLVTGSRLGVKPGLPEARTRERKLSDVFGTSPLEGSSVGRATSNA